MTENLAAKCSYLSHQFIINQLQFLSRTAHPGFKRTAFTPGVCSVRAGMSQLGMLTSFTHGCAPCEPAVFVGRMFYKQKQIYSNVLNGPTEAHISASEQTWVKAALPLKSQRTNDTVESTSTVLRPQVVGLYQRCFSHGCNHQNIPISHIYFMWVCAVKFVFCIHTLFCHLLDQTAQVKLCIKNKNFFTMFTSEN